MINRAPPLLARFGPVLLAGWMLAVALLTRASVLGDWAYFNDETFYFLAARRMHQGAWLYADVWDRKGPGLFATYWLATAFSPTLAACRWLALSFAAATACVLAHITRIWAGWAGGVLAGTLYLAAIPMFVGGGAQSQVFYNLYIALAAWLVLNKGPRGAVAAMALAGLALTYKQTALCEGVFLGLWALARAWQGGAGRRALILQGAAMAIAGAAPMLLAGAIFAAGGHFGVFWHAMVTSNLVKHYDPWGDHWIRIHALTVAASPVLVLAAAGLALGAVKGGKPRSGRAFLTGWVLAAIAGLLVVPNFYADYTLPLMAPLCVCAGLAMARYPLGWLGATAALTIYLLATSELDFAGRRAASHEVEALAQAIRQRQPQARLLVYEGPMALYALAGEAPPSPLLDNFHLNFPFENNTSHLDTAREIRRILAWRPDVVVMYHGHNPASENPRTAGPVRAYLSHCRLWQSAPYHEIAASPVLDVYGDCARNQQQDAPRTLAKAQ